MCMRVCVGVWLEMRVVWNGFLLIRLYELSLHNDSTLLLLLSNPFWVICETKCDNRYRKKRIQSNNSRAKNSSHWALFLFYFFSVIFLRLKLTKSYQMTMTTMMSTATKWKIAEVAFRFFAFIQWQIVRVYFAFHFIRFFLFRVAMILKWKRTHIIALFTTAFHLNRLGFAIETFVRARTKPWIIYPSKRNATRNGRRE